MLQAEKRIELTTTLRRVRVPSFVADQRGVITWLNDAAKRTFGDLTGRHFRIMVAAEDVPLVERQLARKLRGVLVTDYEIGVIDREGRRRRAEISSVPIEGRDHCHAIFGVVLTTRPFAALSPHPRLTRRQNDVLHLLGEGLSTGQIAVELHLSTETVRNHIRNILRTLGAHSRLEAVAIARRQGLLGDD